jgi:plasmid stabilization system protein ParE
MARSLRWTESALADLEEAAAFIEKGSRYYAAALVREVRGAAKALKRFGERGRIVPEFDDPAIRELVVQSYRVVCRVDADIVWILAVVHGTRDLRTLWDRKLRDRASDDPGR